MTEYLRYDESEVFRFARDVFQAVGVPTEHAATVAGNLTQGELHGMGSHGVSRLLPVYARRFQAGGFKRQPDVRVIQSNRSTALVDGDDGPGAVAGNYAMNLALDLAREHGSGWVGVRNSQHYGAAFIFARQALPLGMIGFATTAAVPQVAPYGGTRRALGTNPFCIAVPGGRRGDMILDIATSVVARGKVQLYALEGKPIPLGWALDADGRPTTDSVAASAGSMLPLGGHKGYGLALIVEILSSMLTGAAFGDRIGQLFDNLDTPQNVGHFFGALDISGFIPIDAFKERMDTLVDYVKANPLAEGHDEILVPGELEARKAAEYRREGIPIAVDVATTFADLAADLDVCPLAARA
jgi:LDH2 family malate/lactate/ureidoglycolate dehydrogenase